MVFGLVISVVVHVAFLFVLSFASASKPTAPAEGTEQPPAAAEEPAPPKADDSVPSRPVALPSSLATPVHEPAPTPEAEWVTYTVRKGDMLDRLVKKAGCSVSEAARYNKTTVKKLSALKVGQKIKLPKFKED